MHTAYEFRCQSCPCQVLYHKYPKHLEVEGCPNCRTIPVHNEVKAVLLDD